MLRQMVRIRQFEDNLYRMYMARQIPGISPHLSVGQEAVAVGVCTALEDMDYVLTTHRGHGHLLAKGAGMDGMLAEILGKETGYCHGRGGSMHIADVSLNIIGANGIVGAGLPIAVGAALSSKYRDAGAVAVCFFGDAAANMGAFHEALNMAAIWRLPVVWVCENNQYGLSSSSKEMIAGGSVAGERALRDPRRPRRWQRRAGSPCRRRRGGGPRADCAEAPPSSRPSPTDGTGTARPTTARTALATKRTSGRHAAPSCATPSSRPRGRREPGRLCGHRIADRRRSRPSHRVRHRLAGPIT